MSLDNSVEDIDAGNEFASEASDLNNLGQVTGNISHDAEGSHSTAFRLMARWGSRKPARVNDADKRAERRTET
jgi:phage gp45-like